MNIVGKLLEEHNMSQKELALTLGIAQPSVSAWVNQKADPTGHNAKRIAEIFGIDRDSIIVSRQPAEEKSETAPDWNVQYPAGVALRTVPVHQPNMQLSEADIGRIAERVAQINQDAKTSPILNRSEQQLIEEYRMLSTAQRLRVQRLIDVLLDNKFNKE